MGQKQYPYSRNHTSNFEFWSFPGLVICDMKLPGDPGHWQWASAPSQACDHEGKQLINVQPFCTHATILLFTFSTVFNKLHDIQDFYYKRGVVLDESTQLWDCYKCSEHV